MARLPSGYPRLVESKDYPGLKPGLWIVTLGVCQPVSAELLAALKAVQPQLYARALTGKAELACPTLLDTSIKAEKNTVQKKPLVLAAVTVEDGPAEGEQETASQTFVVLRNEKTGEVLDVAAVEGAVHTPSGSGPEGPEYLTCTSSVEVKAGSLVVTRDCGDGNTGCPGTADHIDKSWLDVTKLSISGQTIQRKSSHKVTATTACAATPDGEGD